MDKYFAYFINLGFYSEKEFNSVEEAVKYVASTSFDATILKTENGVHPYLTNEVETVGTWTYFQGFVKTRY